VLHSTTQDILSLRTLLLKKKKKKKPFPLCTWAEESNPRSQ
jgi:hypothetical protein